MEQLHPELRKCIKCKKWKPLEEYGKAYQYRVMLDGTLKQYVYTHGSCNGCRADYMDKYHAKNRRKDTKAFRIDSKLTAY